MDMNTFEPTFLIQIEGRALSADLNGEITSFVFETIVRIGALQIILPSWAPGAPQAAAAPLEQRTLTPRDFGRNPTGGPAGSGPTATTATRGSSPNLR